MFYTNGNTANLYEDDTPTGRKISKEENLGINHKISKEENLKEENLSDFKRKQ